MKKPVPRRGTHRGEAGLSFRWPGHFLLEINNTKSELRPLAITALALSSGSRVNEEGGASGEVVFVVIATRCRGDLWRVTLPKHTFPFCKVWIMMLFISLSFVIMINLGNVCNDAF